MKVIGGIGDKAVERTARAERLEINAAETSNITSPDVMQSESVLFILLLSNRVAKPQGTLRISLRQIPEKKLQCKESGAEPVERWARKAYLGASEK
ncbi:MAG TPA: hypothetical protein VN743_01390 [Blastocatellia bacterium]|nr:hypothetical protein [Blastocatellia bacterium]